MISTRNVYRVAPSGYSSRNDSVRKAVSTALFATLAAATPMTVFAADVLEEIVVTAQFREEKLQDTPIAITALSGDMLEARNQTNITQIAAVAPNVTLTQAGSGFGNSASASIRGIGQYDFNFALEPGVGMYIDDVYYGVLFGSVFELTDLERVEVLRGPQGTLAGKNSIGGSIKLFSKKPTGEGGFLEVGAGNYNQRSIRASADMALIQDKLMLRISGVNKQRTGYFKLLDYNCATGASATPGQIGPSCQTGTQGGQDLTSLRASLRWIVNDSIEDNVIVDSTRDKSEVQPTKLISGGPWAGTANYLTGPKSYTSYATFVGYSGTANQFSIPQVNNANGWGASNTLDVKFSDGLSLKSITAYRHADGDFSQDIDASPADVETIYNIVSHKQFSQELRLSGSAWHNVVNYTVGAYYYDAQQTIAGRKDIAGGSAVGGGLALLPSPPFNAGARVTLLDFRDNDVIDSNSKSVFGHLEVHPLADMTLTGGVRYTKESKDYLFRRIITGLPGATVPFDPTGVQLGSPGAPFALGPLDGKTGSYSGSKTDFRFGVDYRWSPTLMTYAQVSTGFKGGGSNPRPFNVAQLQDFGQEKLTAYEVGAKSDIGSHLRVNGSVFLNKYKDIQLTSLACPTAPCALPVNAGDANIQGAELEATLRFGGLTIDASGSYLDFEYTRLSGAIGTTYGMITPFTPTKKGSVGVQYALATAGGTLTPRIDWSYTGEMFDSAVNGDDNFVASHVLLDGRLGWKSTDGTWEAALFGTNLLNKFYYANKFGLPAAPFSVVTGQPGRPREWGVTVRRNF